MTYERDNIARLRPYTPGEQPGDQQQVIKLNTNENPYPPAESVLKAIAGISPQMLGRYPSPTAHAFRQAAASVHGLHPTQVIATNGGDELLRLAVTAFCNPRAGGDDNSASGGLGVSDPTYSLYPVIADIADIPLCVIRRGEDFSLSDNFAGRLNDAGCRLAFLVNPHAPSGRLESVETLQRVAGQFNGVLLIDEAYVDFAHHDALALLDSSSGLDNVLILRTVSKGYSLAGIRFGYGLGHANLIGVLDKVRDSYSTDVVSQAAAVAALQSRDEAAETWQQIIDQRERLSEHLIQRGYTVYPSQTNFVLVIPPADGADAVTIYRRLKEQGVLVRYFDQDALRDKLRITVGTKQECDALIGALDQL